MGGGTPFDCDASARSRELKKAKTTMGFSRRIQEKALLACGRHCCLCKKYASYKIELHHIVQKADGGDDSFDNCVPLCFDCHAEVRAYNPKHPKGKKFTASELKAHRDNWYREIKQLGTNHFQKSAQSSITSQSDGLFHKFDLSSFLHDSLSQLNREAKQERAAESNYYEKTAKPDYILRDPVVVESEKSFLLEKLAALKNDSNGARKLGLKGVVESTNEIITSVQSQIEALERRIEIINHGYEHWERIGFQIACDACCFYYNWFEVGSISERNFVANEEFDIIMPQKAYEALEQAIATNLFNSIELCAMIEPPDDPEEIYAKSVTNFLFGLSDQGNNDLFFLFSLEG